MAAKAGASKVYAIEGNLAAYEKAVLEVKDQGLSDVSPPRSSSCFGLLEF